MVLMTTTHQLHTELDGLGNLAAAEHLTSIITRAISNQPAHNRYDILEWVISNLDSIMDDTEDDAEIARTEAHDERLDNYHHAIKVAR